MELDERDNSAPPCSLSGDELIFNGCSGKKRKNVCSEFTLRGCKKKTLSLHEDIICSILVKLPSTSVIRFKSACKSWKSLISDPYFIKLFYQQQLKMKEEQPLGSGIIIVKQMPLSNHIRFYMIDDVKQDSSLSMKFLLECHLPSLMNEDSIFCHPQFCDGLILLELKRWIFVCNLTTRELIYIPVTSNPNNLVSQEFDGTCGLGFDRSTKRYKIVRYFYRSIDLEKRSYSLGLEVFTLGLSNTWRQIVEDPPYPVKDVAPTSAEGAIYWEVWDKLHTSSHLPILRFDLSDEKFRVIDPPPLPPARFNITSDLVASLFGNLFYFIVTHPTESGSLWMLNQEEKWTPTCKLNFNPGLPRSLLLASIHRQNLIFSQDEALYAYNFETKSSSKLFDVSNIFNNGEFNKSLPQMCSLTVTDYVENILPIELCP